jgi:hypothetical protein
MYVTMGPRQKKSPQPSAQTASCPPCRVVLDREFICAEIVKMADIEGVEKVGPASQVSPSDDLEHPASVCCLTRDRRNLV